MAVRWEASGRAPDLLIRGSELERIRSWRDKRPGDAPELTGLQRAYIVECEEAEIQTQNRERKRLAEIAVAQEQREAALAEAEEAQRGKDAATKRLVGRTISGMLIAFLLAGLAGWQWFEAQLQTKQTEAALQEAQAASELALEQRQKAIEAQSIAAEEARKALAASTEANEKTAEYSKLLRYFKLVQLASESAISNQLPNLRIEFRINRSHENVGLGPFLECPHEKPDMSQTRVFNPNSNDESKVSHCDTMLMIIENTSVHPVDATLLFLTADFSIEVFPLPVATPPRIPPKTGLELPFTVVGYDSRGLALPFGRERLLVIAVEARHGSPIANFSNLSPIGGPPRNEFERLLHLHSLNTAARSNAFSTMTEQKGAIWQYYWDLVARTEANRGSAGSE